MVHPLSVRRNNITKEEVIIISNNRLINIGFGSSVPIDVVLAIMPPESAPVKRKIEEAKQGSLLIDATFGRKTRAVIFTKTNHVILTGIQSETIQKRFNEDKLASNM